MADLAKVRTLAAALHRIDQAHLRHDNPHGQYHGYGEALLAALDGRNPATPPATPPARPGAAKNHDPDKACPHLGFAADVAVNRIADQPDTPPTAYIADITVRCADCDEPFRWTGVRAGVSFNHPMVSVDEKELHAPLRPASADPDFGMGLPGFAIGYRKGGAG